jgi:phosphoenolpyruvate-protein phosphotransferase
LRLYGIVQSLVKRVETVQRHEHNTLHGASIAPGLAMGTAFVCRDILEQDLYRYSIQADQVDAECARVQAAGAQVIADLDESARRIEEQVGHHQAEIYHVHQTMLGDLIQAREIREELQHELVNVEVAVQKVFQRWTDRLRAAESTGFTQRGDDVADLGRRLVQALRGIAVHPLERMPEGSVLVARRLFPSDAVFFGARATAAVVVEFGSPGSHCALLTRQLGIPGVCSISEATERIVDGDMLLVDGFRGEVVTWPTEEIRERFERHMGSYRQHAALAKKRCREPAYTPAGAYIPVMANIANRPDAELAAESGADGVGLYRIEALFMRRNTLPTEGELVAEISDTLAPLEGKPAIIRLLDLGSDKNLPYLQFVSEPAPCLGMRGIRLLLAYPDLLSLQLRALLQLSQVRDVQIMVPMITIAEDMREIRKAVQLHASQLGIANVPPLVAMVETPAAALSVREILRFADAVSLGTNDLTQHTMAAARQNPLVYRYFKDDHPSVLRLIRLAVEEADEALVAVCGELASQPQAIPMLLDAGVRLLSVAPPLVPAIKEAVRGVHLEGEAETNA